MLHFGALREMVLIGVQRNFRKVLRSALYDARGIVSVDIEEQRIKRREFLSLYRWANSGVGLAL